jgi:hypothetical protein
MISRSDPALKAIKEACGGEYALTEMGGRNGSKWVLIHLLPSAGKGPPVPRILQTWRGKMTATLKDQAIRRIAEDRLYYDHENRFKR